MGKPDKLETKPHKNLKPALIATIVTAVGIYGGLPEMPPILDSLITNYPAVRYVMVFLLLLQGGADFNEATALLGTGIVYVIHQFLLSLNPEDYELTKSKE